MNILRAGTLWPGIGLLFAGTSVLLGQQILESGKPALFSWMNWNCPTTCVGAVSGSAFKIEAPDGARQLEISIRVIDKQPPGANATLGLAGKFGANPDFFANNSDFTVSPSTKKVLVRDGSATGLKTGAYFFQEVISGTGPVTVSITEEVTATLTGANPPAIAPNGVVNAASFQTGVVPNSWVTIQGANLSSVTGTWDKAIVGGKLPTTLDGVSVSIGGKPAYVSYVSPGQINALAADVGTGSLPVTVTNSAGASAPVTVMSQSVGPAFFQWGRYAVATHQNFSWSVKDGTFQGVKTTPAMPSEAIILWGTGFGSTMPAAPVGTQVPADNTYRTASPVSVTVGGVSAQVYGAALAPGYAGLYQVAIQIPPFAPDGDLPVIATINGVQSPSGVLITVQGQPPPGAPPLISNWRDGVIPAGSMISFGSGGKTYYIYPWEFEFEDADGDITTVKGATQGNARLRIQLTSPEKSCTVVDGPDASLNHAGETKGTVKFSTYLPVQWGKYGYSYSVTLFDAAGRASNSLTGPVNGACP